MSDFSLTEINERISRESTFVDDVKKADKLDSKIQLKNETALFDGNGGCFIESGRDSAAVLQVDMFSHSKPSTNLSELSSDNLSKKKEFEKERLSKWL